MARMDDAPNAWVLRVRSVEQSGDAELENGRSLDLKERKDGFLVSRSVGWKSEAGLMVFDPNFHHTALTRSRVVHLDGAAGKLYYRGIDMEKLVDEGCDFLQVAYLLIYGELPSGELQKTWNSMVMHHTFVHEDVLEQIKTFRYDAPPMTILVSSLAALSTFAPEANPSLVATNMFEDRRIRDKQIVRILGKVATIAACSYRVRIGRPLNYPDATGNLSYSENFLALLDRMSEPRYRPDPRVVSLFDRMLVALADIGMSSATSLLHHVASSKVDPYNALSTAIACTYGARIGSVGKHVLDMLEALPSDDASVISEFIESAKSEKRRIPGFGHIVFKAYDPRARVLKKIAIEAQELFGDDAQGMLLRKAMRVEDVILGDPYFQTRHVFTNADYYLALAQRILGFPSDYFTVIVAMARTAGWLAHWNEMQQETALKICRPRQVYMGHGRREYVDIDAREDGEFSADARLLSSVPSLDCTTEEAHAFGFERRRRSTRGLL
ncbi:Citrate synthase [Porphyridium purpureum]|uniref:Citrate synthase n=1 Tax=Porphyridium purpureum TaxID=35688 RepID=A0A5J4Z7R2_PORPP|nr:Citrate synthase [Porphyridium purpureum]|eukprot:POR5499..scf295_1